MAVREVDRAGGKDTGAIKTKKMEGKSNQTEILTTSFASLNLGRRGNGAHPS